MKKFLLKFRDIMVAYSKFIFPILLIAIVAVTVSVALNARDQEGFISDVFESMPVIDVPLESEAEEQGNVTAESESGETENTYIPLELNAYPEVFSLICTYYDALANGKADIIEGICNYIEEMEKIKIQELGNYIERYPVVEVYTKPGPEEGSYVVFAYTKAKFHGFDEEVAGIQTFYVCTDKNGVLHLNEGELTQEELDYIYTIVSQDDVVELSNKATVEYKETMVANPELFEFIAQMENDIRTNTGLIIASQETGGSQNGEGQTGEEQTGEGQTGEGQTGEGQTGESQTGEEQTGESQTGEGQSGETQNPTTVEILYAKATTTVNVRGSASTEGERLGQVSKGARIRVYENLANGWSKVDYEGKEGYIMSKYLEMEESQGSYQVIGTVTATTNLRIREQASTGSASLGLLVEGETVELLEVANGWCKIVYNGNVAYVSEKYVTKKLN